MKHPEIREVAIFRCYYRCLHAGWLTELGNTGGKENLTAMFSWSTSSARIPANDSQASRDSMLVNRFASCEEESCWRNEVRSTTYISTPPYSVLVMASVLASKDYSRRQKLHRESEFLQSPASLQQYEGVSGSKDGPYLAARALIHEKVSTSIIVLGGLVGTGVSAPTEAPQLIDGLYALACATEQLESTCIGFNTYCNLYGDLKTGFAALCGTNNTCWCYPINSHCGIYCGKSSDEAIEGDEKAVKTDDGHAGESDGSHSE